MFFPGINSQPMSWKHLAPFDPQALAGMRQQFHQAAQSVAAVGRFSLATSEDDGNAVLQWHTGLHALVGKWISGPVNEVRAGISILQGTIFIEKKESGLSSLEIDNKTYPQLMTWLEGQVGEAGLPVNEFSASLPYEIPSYPTQKGAPFDVSNAEMRKALSNWYEDTDLVLSKLQPRFEQPMEMRVWPHRFDYAASVTLKDSGSADTSTYLGLGMSPGDENYDQPYFYVNSWPFVEEDRLKPLPYGSWHVDDWVGAVLLSEEVVREDRQVAMVTDFFLNASEQLRDLLLE